MRKNLAKRIPLLFTFTLLLFLFACGDGDTPQEAHEVTVAFALQGNAATVVGSVDLDVVLPDGFVLETDSTNQPTTSAMTLLVPDATFALNYIPATVAANGAIKGAIIKAGGFAGNANLVQMTHTFAAGATLPNANDFVVTFVASDLNGVPLSGVTGQISITTQPVP